MVIKYLAICLPLLSITAAAQQSETISKKKTVNSSKVKSDYLKSRAAAVGLVTQLNKNVLAGMKIDEIWEWKKEESVGDHMDDCLKINCFSRDGKLVTFAVVSFGSGPVPHFEMGKAKMLTGAVSRIVTFVFHKTAYTYRLEITSGKFVLRPEANGGKGLDYNEISSGGMGN